MTSRPISAGDCIRRALAILALLALAGAALAQAPFVPGVRWRTASGGPLPQSVRFGASDSVAWAFVSGAQPRLDALAAHARGAPLVLGSATGDPSALGSTQIAAGDGPWLGALVQLPEPDAWQRRTHVRGYDARAFGQGARWSHAFDFRGNGPARLACDRAGSAFVAAAWNDATKRVHVVRLAAATGLGAWSTNHAAPAFQALAASDDLGRVALALGAELLVLDASGLELARVALPAAPVALALAGDGRRLVCGIPGGARVVRETSGAWTSELDLPAAPGEVLVAAALAHDGLTLALGWHAPTARAGRFEVWNVATATRLVERALPAPPAPLENRPAAVEVTRDGARAACAAWGSAGPELFVWDRASATYALEQDFAGSALALALDASGTRALVALKATHANLPSALGEIALVESGERELQLLAPARPGGAIELAAKMPGADHVLFLEGRPRATPFPIQGLGDLLVARQGLHIVRVACDASGRADLAIPLPADPALVGTRRSVQAAFQAGGRMRLGRTRLDLMIF